jgi:hypothetical protein
MYQEQKETLVRMWGFYQKTDILFQRDSEIAMELWSALSPDVIQILDKSNNQVNPYSIDWSLFEAK